MRAGISTVAGMLALAAAGCSGGGFSFGDLSPAGLSGPQPAPVDMNGRWLLSAIGTPACGMTFAGTRSEGTIAPEGGCPGNFFTSRRWSFEQNALVIRDHNGEILGRLAFAASRYEGNATSGQQIALSR